MISCGYTRAYADRDATTPDGPLRFVMASEGLKGDGIDLRMNGADLRRFRSNPLVGYGHTYMGRDNLPIGRVENIETDGTRLLADVVFDVKDDFAALVDRKYRDGFLNAVSVGFDVTAWEDPYSSYRTGGVATEWEFIELSAVPLPMDGDAVVSSGRSLDQEFIAQWLLRAMGGIETPAKTSEVATGRHPLSLYRALALAQD